LGSVKKKYQALNSFHGSIADIIIHTTDSKEAAKFKDLPYGGI
jgi:hypothetical protein